jgi:hypothetical protein
MKDKGIDWRDKRLILKLYKAQTTIIDINRAIKGKIRKGIRQGCPLSLYLFNIFIKASINELKNNTGEIKINGQRIHCMRFSDDIVRLAKSQNDMNKMLNTLADVFDEYQLKINGQKTKTMLINKINNNDEINIKLRNNSIQVNEFCYLESFITNRN